MTIPKIRMQHHAMAGWSLGVYWRPSDHLYIYLLKLQIKLYMEHTA